ncbi:hypothetical protein SZ55_3904 [Pseudomonas sp. FeS53a]|nr:hypothetical protein SZ55_3904 [Pseudomonas sp. FeS53a]
MFTHVGYTLSRLASAAGRGLRGKKRAQAYHCRGLAVA